MHYSERPKIVERVLPLIGQKISKETFEQVIQTIENSEKYTVDGYNEKVDNLLKNWGFNPATFKKEKAYLFVKGLLNASDAFDAQYIESTAKTIKKEIIKNDLCKDYDSLLSKHQEALNRTPAFKKIRDDESNKILGENPDQIEESFKIIRVCYIEVDNPKVFQKGLKDQDGRVRRYLTKALRSYKGPNAHSLIEVALKNQDRDIRSEAASALGRYKGPNAYFLIELGLKDQDAKVRSEAVTLLRSYTGADAHSLIELALKNQDYYVRSGAALALIGYRGDKTPILKAMINLLNYDDPEIRKEVAELLKEQKASQYIENEAARKALRVYIYGDCEEPMNRVIDSKLLEFILEPHQR